jgi:lipid-A-disaccharide synthase
MTKKFFIIAGEASGDLLSSKLMAEIKLIEKDVEFIGVGGELMKKEGLQSIFSINELSIMGFVEILPKIFKLISRIKQTAKAIIDCKPDYIITVDAPDFCFRVIKKLPRNFSKKIHLIAPSVWAYRSGRAKKIAKIYDLLLCILPFETPYFEKYGLKSVFIGHPIIEKAPDFSKKMQKNLEFRLKYQISNEDKLIIITPGSRNSEVSKIFPEFINTINILSKKFNNLKVAIPLTTKTKDLVSKAAKDLSVSYFLINQDEKEEMFFAGDFALAKSGTNTMEISLYEIPMIIAYKLNVLSHFLLKMMIKIKFANLINLILNKEIIPEMLQNKCRGELMAQKLENLMINKDLAANQLNQSRQALEILGLGSKESASKKAALEILKL